MRKLRLFLTLLCTAFLCQTANADLVYVNGIQYSTDESTKTAWVLGGPDVRNATGEIKILASFNYAGINYSVTRIANAAFSYCDRITSVIIPNSVTSIGQGSFRDCSGLTSMTIPNSVTSIEKRAFYGCSKLKEISLPESITELPDYCFRQCI